jgi:hypothetical protein
MRKRWLQRNAWIAWILASLIGWAAIFSLYASIDDSGDETLADKEKSRDDSGLMPASGPSAGKSNQ